MPGPGAVDGERNLKDSDASSDDDEEGESSDASRPQVANPSPGAGQMEVSTRYRCCTLLWVGCMNAYMAFVTSFIITLISFLCRTKNELGEFPSGYGNFPQTVSESVSSHFSPQGKLFFAFGLIAGICIFFSFYPYMLRNVYTGNENFCNMGTWISLRQYVPCLGLILLICVTTVPAYMAKDIDYFSVAFHLIGAGMMFIGYLVCELKCLEMFGFQAVDQGRFLSIEPDERFQRQICGMLIFLGFTSFLIAQVVLLVFDDDSTMCCHDAYASYKWYLRPSDHVLDNRKNEKGFIPVLEEAQTDTATGWVLAWKMISFFTECLAGVALVTSHFLIWYHCEERHVDYSPHPLLSVYDERNNVMTDSAVAQLMQFAGSPSGESTRTPEHGSGQMPDALRF